MKPWYLMPCILMLALVFCMPCAAGENVTPKAVVLDLSLSGDTVHVVGPRVVYNYPPDNRATETIVIRMLDGRGTLLGEQGIDDPRIAYVEEGIVIRDSVNFSVIVPFQRDLATISLVNGTTGAGMIAADVSGSVNGFCKEHTGDPDCAAAAGTSPPLPVAPVAVIVAVLAGTAWYLLEKKEP